MCGNQSQKTDWAVLNWEEFNHLLDMKTISWQVQNTQPSQPITWSILTNNNTKHPKQPFNRIINSCGWSRQVHLSWLHTIIHWQVCYPDRVCRQDKLLLNTILCLYHSSLFGYMVQRHGPCSRKTRGNYLSLSISDVSDKPSTYTGMTVRNSTVVVITCLQASATWWVGKVALFFVRL